MRRGLVLVILISLMLGPSLASATSAPTTSPEEGAAVTLRISPRWGTVTPGTWTPYVVTVRNQGPQNVEGTIRLVPDGASASPTSPSASPSSIPLPPSDQFPLHERPVALAAGTEKTLELLVVEPPSGYRAELLDGPGAILASATREPPSAGGPGVVLLSHVDDAEDHLVAMPGPPGQHPVFTQVSAEEFPSDVLSLSGVRAVIISGVDVAQLGPRRVDALRDFVGLGGNLVLGGGSAGHRNLNGLPDELLPLRSTATATVSLAALADLARQNTDASTIAMTGDVGHGQSLLDAVDGVPLVIESAYGAGAIVQLTYDPLAEPFTTDPSLFDAGWGPALAPALAPRVPPGVNEQRIGAASPWPELWSEGPGNPIGPTWPAFLGGLLVAYLLIVGIVGTLVARRRRVLLWISLPVTTMAFAAIVLVVGRDVAASRDALVIEIETVGTSGVVVTESYQQVAPGEDAVTPGAGHAASTVLTDRFPLAPIPTGGVTSGVGNGVVLEGGHVIGLRLQDPLRENTVQTLASRHGSPLSTSNFRLHGGTSPGDPPKSVTGRITNTGTEDLRHLRAQIPAGMQAELVDSLAPGESFDIDARFAWPDARAASASNHRMVIAAANRTLAHHGSFAITAEQGAGAAPSRGVSIVIQTVGPETLDAPGRVLPVSAVPLEESRWLHVYDLVPSIASGSAFLEYPFREGLANVDVYNWATGTWRRLPGSDVRFGPNLPPVPLTPDEVGARAIRVRAEEPAWADGTAVTHLRLAPPGASGR